MRASAAPTCTCAGRGAVVPEGAGHPAATRCAARVAKLGARRKADSLGRPLREGDRVAYAYFIRVGNAGVPRRDERLPNRYRTRNTLTADDPPHFLGAFGRSTTCQGRRSGSSRYPTGFPTSWWRRSTARCRRWSTGSSRSASGSVTRWSSRAPVASASTPVAWPRTWGGPGDRDRRDPRTARARAAVWRRRGDRLQADAREGRPRPAVRELTGGFGADVVVEGGRIAGVVQEGSR